MRRLTVFYIFFILLALVESAFAEPLIFRVRLLEAALKSDSKTIIKPIEKVPKDASLLWSIEVAVGDDSTLYGKSIMEGQTIELKGSVKKLQSNRFLVNYAISYIKVKSSDTASKPEHVQYKTNSTVSVALGQYLVAGGFQDAVEEVNTQAVKPIKTVQFTTLSLLKRDSNE